MFKIRNRNPQSLVRKDEQQRLQITLFKKKTGKKIFSYKT